jgi:hypothetical protein
MNPESEAAFLDSNGLICSTFIDFDKEKHNSKDH